MIKNYLDLRNVLRLSNEKLLYKCKLKIVCSEK